MPIGIHATMPRKPKDIADFMGKDISDTYGSTPWDTIVHAPRHGLRAITETTLIYLLRVVTSRKTVR